MRGREREGRRCLAFLEHWESAERLSGTDQHGFCSPASYGLDDAALPWKPNQTKKTKTTKNNNNNKNTAVVDKQPPTLSRQLFSVSNTVTWTHSSRLWVFIKCRWPHSCLKSTLYVSELQTCVLYFYLALCPDEPLIARLIKSRPRANLVELRWGLFPLALETPQPRGRESARSLELCLTTTRTWPRQSPATHTAEFSESFLAPSKLCPLSWFCFPRERAEQAEEKLIATSFSILSSLRASLGLRGLQGRGGTVAFHGAEN